MIIEMIDKITAAMDSNAFSVGIFIDLSKAFDTLNHNILFNKLQHYAVHGVALQCYNGLNHACIIPVDPLRSTNLHKRYYNCI